MSTDVPLPEPVALIDPRGLAIGAASMHCIKRPEYRSAADADAGVEYVSVYTADHLRAYGDARAAALAGVLRLVVGDAEMFCRAAHHSKADRHEAFEPCPIHTRAVAALQEQKP